MVGMTQSSSRKEIRCFVALEVNDAVRDVLEEMQGELQGLGGLRANWTRPENFHLTLQFLGTISSEQLASVVEVVDACGMRVPEMDLDVRGVGFFGSPHRPRVIWAGVDEHCGVLTSLVSCLRVGFSRLGWAPERNSFHPHITLGRVRAATRVDSLTSQLGSATSRSFGSCRADRVTVFQSILHPQGARYQVLHATRLKGA